MFSVVSNDTTLITFIFHVILYTYVLQFQLGIIISKNKHKITLIFISLCYYYLYVTYYYVLLCCALIRCVVVTCGKTIYSESFQIMTKDESSHRIIICYSYMYRGKQRGESLKVCVRVISYYNRRYNFVCRASFDPRFCSVVGIIGNHFLGF